MLSKDEGRANEVAHFQEDRGAVDGTNTYLTLISSSLYTYKYLTLSPDNPMYEYLRILKQVIFVFLQLNKSQGIALQWYFIQVLINRAGLKIRGQN